MPGTHETELQNEMLRLPRQATVRLADAGVLACVRAYFMPHIVLSGPESFQGFAVTPKVARRIMMDGLHARMTYTICFEGVVRSGLPDKCTREFGTLFAGRYVVETRQF
jgi:hypothetical protein